MKSGWLVNDHLTCVPNTVTFWHDLLEWIPNLENKTHSPFKNLAKKTENIFKSTKTKPHYIIRNATFFRKLNIHCKQISLLQDCYFNLRKRSQQISVCNDSNITVCNSLFTYENYKQDLNCDVKIIPLGIDFNLFKPLKSSNRELNILPKSILFVGASTNNPKGFDKIHKLIETTDYNFCLVMKDDYEIKHRRVRVFNRVGHDTLVKIYNSCEMLICASTSETQHLATIEAGACDLPIITTNVGAMYNIKSGEWGLKIRNNNFSECIEFILKNKGSFSPRKYFLKNGFDKETCKKNWLNLVGGL